ncbi:MAG: sensor domain-containing diguanylate cyclase [Deltaproteobacteria bacterium]|nr:sensor domain-containing diguanylate cyclase [Deltaproteobacteria bacterium]
MPATIAPTLAATLVVFAALGRFVSPDRVAIALLGASVVTAIWRAVRRQRARNGDRSIAALDGSTGMLVVALTYVAIGASGGALRSPLAALPVVALAVTGALAAPFSAVLAVLFAVLSELVFQRLHAERTLGELALRCATLLLAAAAHTALTRLEVARVRDAATRALDDERARQKEAVRSFRLNAAPSQTPHLPAEDSRRARSSLDEIRESTQGLLELARRSLDLHTCAIYWLDPRSTQLRLVGAVTSAEEKFKREPISVGTGAVGGVAAMKRPVLLSKLRPDYAGLTYYAGPHEVRSFLGVAIMDGEDLRGVVIADRNTDRVFDENEQIAVQSLAAQAQRLVQTERLFAAMEKSKDELAKMHGASRALGDALTEDEVIRAVVESAHAFASHDLCVLTSIDSKTHEHRVRFVDGKDHESLQKLTFMPNKGIVSSVVESRHPLPYRGNYDSRSQVIFTKEHTLAGMESVYCLPLVVRDHAIGTLTLAAHRRGAFSESTRELLALLAGNAAVALSNAAAVRRLEELATTDPMTGLLNKRSLEAEFDKRLRSAARFGKKLSVLVTDIDKFKNVNDTYGHSIGDVVIKGLGAILTKCKRDTDAVARFGGEEFVLVCEETDIEGAYLLAERIRTELEKTVFNTEKGPIKVTCSLGVAEFTKDYATRELLFTRADEALYEAKRAGRNRSIVAGEAMHRAPISTPPSEPVATREPQSKTKANAPTATRSSPVISQPRSPRTTPPNERKRVAS